MNASLSMKKLEVLHFSSYSTSKKEGSVKVEYLVDHYVIKQEGLRLSLEKIC